MDFQYAKNSLKALNETDVMIPASLFEEDFSIDWLIQLTGQKASVILESLEKACDGKILKKRSYGLFFFVDVDVQKQYQKKLESRQADLLHRKIAQILLEELPDGEEKARRIAAHILGVEADLERCHWLSKAGDMFLRSHNVENAVRYYKKLLVDLSGIEGSEADALYLRSAINYSKITDIQFDTKDTLRFLREALKRSEKAGNTKSTCLLNMYMAKNEWYRSRYATAIKRFNRAWEASIEIKDPTLMRSAVTFSTFFHYWQGRFQEAVLIFERDVSDIDKSPAGNFPIMATATVGYCYTLTGQPAHGIGIIDSARSISKGQGETFLTGFCEVVMAITLLNIQRFDEAIEYINMSYKNVNRWPDSPVHLFCHLLLSYAYFLKGDSKKSVKYLTVFLKKRKSLEVSMWPYPYLMELCWAMEIGQLPRLKGISIQQEIESAFKTGNVLLTGIAFRYKAFCLQKNGKRDSEILNSLKKSVSWVEKSGHKIETARARLALANHFFSKNNEKKGKEITQKASADLFSFDPSFIPGNLRALVKTRHKNQALSENLRYVGQKISESGNSLELIHQLLKSANQVLGAERGALFGIDAKKGEEKVFLMAGQNLTAEQAAHDSFGFSMKTIRTVFETEEATLLNQTSQPPDFAEEPVRSLICAPIKHGKRLMGVLYYDNRLLMDAFKPEDRDILSFYAALVAMAMINRDQLSELTSIKLGLLNKGNNKEYETGAFGMIGNSNEIKKVYATIEQVSGTDSTVLILGETGVGKELVANAIHLASSRKDRAFVAVNCNALPDSLISSELFGHEKGAFTGAVGKRAGRFELADKGTLFIDEIGEMPLETQVRLLRVLQTKEFERIGGTKTITSDFRLIVATNRDIEAEVKKGNFRSDLFYRLSTFPVIVPPLRERRSDIPLLAHHFVKKYSLISGKEFISFPEKEMNKLKHNSWPGNVRELEHIIERATILSSGSIFMVPELSTTLTQGNSPGYQQGSTMAEIEKNHILQTLTTTGWKIRGKNGAAEILDLHPSTLYSRMKKHGIKKHFP